MAAYPNVLPTGNEAYIENAASFRLAVTPIADAGWSLSDRPFSRAKALRVLATAVGSGIGAIFAVSWLASLADRDGIHWPIALLLIVVAVPFISTAVVMWVSVSNRFYRAWTIEGDRVTILVKARHYEKFHTEIERIRLVRCDERSLPQLAGRVTDEFLGDPSLHPRTWLLVGRTFDPSYAGMSYCTDDVVASLPKSLSDLQTIDVDRSVQTVPFQVAGYPLGMLVVQFATLVVGARRPKRLTR